MHPTVVACATAFSTAALATHWFKSVQHDRVLVGWSNAQILHIPLYISVVAAFGELSVVLVRRLFSLRRPPGWVGVLTGVAWAWAGLTVCLERFGLTVR